MEGLSDPRPRPAQDHDARRRRVHPSLSPARAAQRLPRIRHYGLFAGTVRARNIERARQALAAPQVTPAQADCGAEDCGAKAPSPARRCPCCGGRMIIVETFESARHCAVATAEPDQDRHLMTVAA